MGSSRLIKNDKVNTKSYKFKIFNDESILECKNKKNSISYINLHHRSIRFSTDFANMNA